MSNRGRERRSVGGNADIYLPHLRPKGIESQYSPRNGIGMVVGSVKMSIGDSDMASASQCSPRKGAGSLLSPILKGKNAAISTAAGSSL